MVGRSPGLIIREPHAVEAASAPLHMASSNATSSSGAPSMISRGYWPAMEERQRNDHIYFFETATAHAHAPVKSSHSTMPKLNTSALVPAQAEATLSSFQAASA